MVCLVRFPMAGLLGAYSFVMVLRHCRYPLDRLGQCWRRLLDIFDEPLANHIPSTQNFKKVKNIPFLQYVELSIV